MKPSTVLKKAKKLIERGWCRHWSAQDKNADYCAPWSRSAVAWCMDGAVSCCTHGSKTRDLYSPSIRFLSAAVGNSIVTFNDSRRKVGPVLRAFDRAIALAEKEGK